MSENSTVSDITTDVAMDVTTVVPSTDAIVSGNFTFTPTSIEGVIIVDSRSFGDARGAFMETYKRPDFEAGGITCEFVQDNQSSSVRGVLRGLHFQIEYPQAKLVRVVSGEVFDVAVDLRPESPTFGCWEGVVLSAENHRQFFVPRGFAHGFYVLSETATFCYKCDDVYRPGDEGGLMWNDPDLGVEWPLMEGSEPRAVEPRAVEPRAAEPRAAEPILSEKDRAHPSFEQYCAEMGYAFEGRRCPA